MCNTMENIYDCDTAAADGQNRITKWLKADIHADMANSRISSQ